MFSRKPYHRPELPPPLRLARPVNAPRCDGGAVSQPKGAATQAKPVTNKIRESARGEECTVRIVGVCTYDPATTIWSHARHADGGKGKGIKALDIAGAYACTACDAAYDQMTGVSHMTREQVDLDWFRGHLRSLVRLAEKGLI